MYYNKETCHTKIKVIISSESAVDLSKDLLDKFNINTINMKICLGEKIIDDSKLSPDAIINYVNSNNNLPKTSAINCEEYSRYFKKLISRNKEEGIKTYVVHFSLSSGLSCSYDNALKASKNFDNVIVIDTKSLSTGIALLIIKFKEYLSENQYLVDVIDKLENDKIKINASLVIEKLKYLRMGGRCSSLISLGTNILKIRPQIIMRSGLMKLGKLFRGSLQSVLYKYCKEVELNINNIDLSNIFITYTTLDPEIILNIENLLKNIGFKNIYITKASGTITTHCGENCLGLLYMNK